MRGTDYQVPSNRGTHMVIGAHCSVGSRTTASLPACLGSSHDMFFFYKIERLPQAGGGEKGNIPAGP